MSDQIIKNKLTAKVYWEDVFLKGEKDCSRCKEFLPINMFTEHSLNKRGYRFLYSHCKTCDKKRTTIFKNKKTETFEGRASFLLTNLNRRARDKNLSNEITIGVLIDIWNKQNGKCYYTGIPMELQSSRKIEDCETKTNKKVVSVDRIDSNKGYTKDNIVLCCWVVNNIKQDLSVEELKDWANLILNPIK
jgi:hypothetical protein